MSSRQRTIWFDFHVPPSVLIFHKVIPVLERMGHRVVITTRDFSQTVQLTKMFGFPQTVVGHHPGNFRGNVKQNLLRVAKLYRFGVNKGIDAAVSDSCISLALATTALRIPMATLHDFEHQPNNHVIFRLAAAVLVPESFPAASLQWLGARPGKVHRFPGTKEEIYLSDFEPDPQFRSRLGLPEDKVLAVVRPPAPWTPYNIGVQYPLYDVIMQRLVSDSNVHTVFMPRIKAQADEARREHRPRFTVMEQPVYGPELVAAADLVLSGGGTMVREASVMGTPSYTVFSGHPAAVDDFLIREGLMRRLSTADDVQQLPLERKQPRGRRRNPELNEWLARVIVEMAER